MSSRDEEPARWRRIDKFQRFPSHLKKEDICYVAREYIPGGGYQASRTNSLILNFKKVPSKINTPEWKYKIEAIQKFAKELSGLLSRRIAVAVIPTSKIPGHPKYDSRLNDVLRELRRINSNVIIEVPISNKESVDSASSEGGSREPADLYRNYKWNGFTNGVPREIIVIDDVLTDGSHFDAFQKLVNEKCPSTKVYGVFWALSVRPKLSIEEMFPD